MLTTKFACPPRNAGPSRPRLYEQDVRVHTARRRSTSAACKKLQRAGEVDLPAPGSPGPRRSTARSHAQDRDVAIAGSRYNASDRVTSVRSPQPPWPSARSNVPCCGGKNARRALNDLRRVIDDVRGTMMLVIAPLRTPAMIGVEPASPGSPREPAHRVHREPSRAGYPREVRSEI